MGQFITSGDMQYNPATGRWQPIGGPIVPFVPSGGDPAAGPGAVLTHDAKADMRRELERLGLPVPAALQGGQASSTTADPSGSAEPVVSIGGTRHLVEGGPTEVTDADLEELDAADAAHENDRVKELEPKHDTERPGPPVQRRRR